MTIKFRDFPVPDYTPTDRVIHLLAVLTNVALVLYGAYWLGTNWEMMSGRYLVLVVALLAGIFLSDFFSGLLHWALDTWFNEATPGVSRVVMIVREHHIYPSNIFKYQLLEELGPNSLSALAFSSPFYCLFLLLGGHQWLEMFVLVVAQTVSVLLVLMLQFHKLGHQQPKTKFLKSLQSLGFVMSPRHHYRHHVGNRDIRYCLINGWADFACDRIGFWRWMERLVTSLTTVHPRHNDHEWLAKYRIQRFRAERTPSI